MYACIWASCVHNVTNSNSPFIFIFCLKSTETFKTFILPLHRYNLQEVFVRFRWYTAHSGRCARDGENSERKTIANGSSEILYIRLMLLAHIVIFYATFGEYSGALPRRIHYFLNNYLKITFLVLNSHQFFLIFVFEVYRIFFLLKIVVIHLHFLERNRFETSVGFELSSNKVTIKIFFLILSKYSFVFVGQHYSTLWLVLINSQSVLSVQITNSDLYLFTTRWKDLPTRSALQFSRFTFLLSLFTFKV